MTMIQNKSNEKMRNRKDKKNSQGHCLQLVSMTKLMSSSASHPNQIDFSTSRDWQTDTNPYYIID